MNSLITSSAVNLTVPSGGLRLIDEKIQTVDARLAWTLELVSRKNQKSRKSGIQNYSPQQDNSLERKWGQRSF